MHKCKQYCQFKVMQCSQSGLGLGINFILPENQNVILTFLNTFDVTVLMRIIFCCLGRLLKFVIKCRPFY